MTKKRRRHKPEQITRKLAEGHHQLAEGKDFDESLGWSQLVAGVLILTAVFLTPPRQKVNSEAKGSKWHHSARRHGHPGRKPSTRATTTP